MFSESFECIVVVPEHDILSHPWVVCIFVRVIFERYAYVCSTKRNRREKKNAVRMRCRRRTLWKTDFIEGNRVPEIVRKIYCQTVEEIINRYGYEAEKLHMYIVYTFALFTTWGGIKW